MNQQKMKSEKYESDTGAILDNDLLKENTPPSIPFWYSDPNVILDKKYIFELFPTDHMTYEQKLNAITRTVIVLTVLGIVLSNKIRAFVIGCITIGVVYLMYHYHVLEKQKTDSKKIGNSLKEGFSQQGRDYLTKNQYTFEGLQRPISDDTFSKPDSHNPFQNVLNTDFDFHPDKKPAPPSFNENINKKILKEAKQLVVEANPDQPDIADKLFKDLGEQLVFEQSLRPFTSNPSTTIPNDQGAFADFCYGSMISCKEGNMFACARNMPRFNNY
jgi:hypothetical protein